VRPPLAGSRGRGGGVSPPWVPGVKEPAVTEDRDELAAIGGGPSSSPPSSARFELRAVGARRRCCRQRTRATALLVGGRPWVGFVGGPSAAGEKLGVSESVGLDGWTS
jgi:hypothetical protein